MIKKVCRGRKLIADNTRTGNLPFVVAKILQDGLCDLSKWNVMSKIELNLKKSSVMWFRTYKFYISSRY